MIQSACRKRSASFISILFAFLLPALLFAESSNDMQTDTLPMSTGTKVFYDVMKVAVPTAVFSGVLLIALNKDIRWYFADRWTRFTSPNHAAPDQYRPFYIKPLWEEQEQETQCDKGVHFTFSYLPVIPLATLLDRSYYLSTSGKLKKEIAPWSVATSAAVISGLAILEEYMDGHQKNEGFSFYDLTANFTGIGLAVAKHYGYFEYLTFYWSFNREMFQNSSQSKRWPWWIYMRGYEFYANIDVMSLIKGIRSKKSIPAAMLETIGYLPDLKGFWRLRYN